MSLEGLVDLVMNVILSKLEAKDVAKVACVNHRLRICASDESLWAFHVAEELNLSAPVDHEGVHLPSFMVAYRVWRLAFSMYPWPLVKRVKNCCERLKNWVSVNFPDALATVRVGATEDMLNEFESSMKVKLPPPARVIYRFFDGQEVPRAKLYGLIGGYSFYNRLVNVYLLSLDGIIEETDHLRHRVDLPGSSKFVVMASSPYIEKYILLNCNNGHLCVGTSNLFEDGEMMPCVPAELSRSMDMSCSDQLEDAFLLWLEEHVRRLESGTIGARGEGKLRCINQFPELPPLCSAAVTNGVQVRASAVLVPEMTDLQGAEGAEGKYMFTYSIRMRLLPEGCTVHGMKYSSCQLCGRYWIIREDGRIINEVTGGDVIGKNPLLLPGDKEFVYESCSFQKSLPASLEGLFMFVPGRLTHPQGERFNVEVAPFHLELPQYIF